MLRFRASGLFVGLLLVVPAMLGAGCIERPTSPPGSGPRPDAETPDAGALAGLYQPCGGGVTCAAGGDCVAIGWFTSLSLCLPRCTDQAACGLDNICYPAASALPPALAQMAGHCFASRCGRGVGNGDVNARCNLGDDVGLGLARPGTCAPYADTGGGTDPVTGASLPFGYCLDGGTVADDGRCDLASRTAGGRNCVAGDLCIGAAGAASGVCEPMCNPLAQTSPGSGPCADAAKSCEDGSLVYRTVGASGTAAVVTVTQGWCVRQAWCSLLAPTTCPVDTVVSPPAPTQCFPTTPVYPHGECFVPSSGAVGATHTGQSCTDPQACVPGDKCALAALPAGAATTCRASIPPGTGASCLAICDPAAAAGAAGSCPSGLACEQDLDAAGDPASGTCDAYTVHWGVCR